MPSPNRNISLLLVTLVASFEAVAQQGLSGPAADGPRIQFASPVHDFGRLFAGETVNWEFRLTNVGTATLEVTNVQSSCGCTTAGDWSRVVEPGKSGIIPVQLNTANLRGPVTKTVMVMCNDKSNSLQILELKGDIDVAVDVIPPGVALVVPLGLRSNTVAKVRLHSNLEEPLTLQTPVSNNRNFTAELSSAGPAKEFELTVRTEVPFDPTNLMGRITIKTSSARATTVSLNVLARIQQAVEASPAQLALPPGPLKSANTYAITIRNNSDALIQLTDPVVNTPDLKLALLEVEAGRRYTLSVTIPAGFQVPVGTNVQIRVKSSHPQIQEVAIPVVQGGKPAFPNQPR